MATEPGTSSYQPSSSTESDSENEVAELADTYRPYRFELEHTLFLIMVLSR